MKKLLAILLILASVLSFAACNKSEYPPVESTEKESTVLMTFKIDGEKYELKYELYRALFLNYAAQYDGGDPSFWQTEAARSAKESINETVISLALDIFSALHLSKKIGFDPYSKEADKLIDGYIKESVDGDGSVEGFGGDYDAYLASLKELNMNYSVQVLMLRYGIAYDKIVDYYSGNEDGDVSGGISGGALTYTEEDVKAFYNGEQSVRVSITVINAQYISLDTAKERRDTMASFNTAEEALNYAVNLTSGDPTDILEGAIVGRNSMDSQYYGEVTEEAFGLDINETSRVIEISANNMHEYWILFRLDKTEEYLNDHYEDIEDAYVSEEIGKILLGKKTELQKTKVETSAFEGLNYAELYEK